MRLKIEPVLAENLLRLARAYIAVRKPRISRVSMMSVSRAANGDWRFFDLLVKGKATFTLRKYDEMIDWFEEHWPPGDMAEMPEPVDPRHGPHRVNPKRSKAKGNVRVKVPEERRPKKAKNSKAKAL